MLLCVGSTGGSWARRHECTWTREDQRPLAHSVPALPWGWGCQGKPGLSWFLGSTGAGRCCPAEGDRPAKKAHSPGARDPEPAVGSVALRGGGWPEGRGAVGAAWASAHPYSYPSPPILRAETGEGWRAHRMGWPVEWLGPDCHAGCLRSEPPSPPSNTSPASQHPKGQGPPRAK